MPSAGPLAPPWSRMEGQVVLVTGASSGIGRDFCLDLARAGCRVVAAARRADRLRSLAEEIPGARLLALKDAGHGVDRADRETIVSAVIAHTATDERR